MDLQVGMLFVYTSPIARRRAVLCRLEEPVRRPYTATRNRIWRLRVLSEGTGRRAPYRQRWQPGQTISVFEGNLTKNVTFRYFSPGIFTLWVDA